jgi:hypothetical protein
MSTNTGRHDYRFAAHDTEDNPLDADPTPTGDATLPPIAPETELGDEGGFLSGQIGAAVPGTNLHLNKTVDTDAPFVHVAPETLLGQEHPYGPSGDDDS